MPQNGNDDFPRQFESGTEYLYGTNTDWAGKLVEKVSGMTLERYFKKKIFKPLGIKSTYFNVPKKESTNESYRWVIEGQRERGLLKRDRW